MNLDTLIEQLTDVCTVISGGDELPENKKLDMESVWELLLKIGKEDLKAIHTVAPMLLLYVEHVPTVRESRFKCCEDSLEALSNTGVSFEERVKIAQSLVGFIFLLHDELTCQVIQKLVDLADEEIKAHPEKVVPKKVCSLLSDFGVDMIPPETFARVMKLLMPENVAAPHKAAPMFILGMMSSDVVEIDDEFPAAANTMIEVGLRDGDREVKVASCFLMGQLTMHWAHAGPEDNAPPREALFDWLVPVMASEDAVVSKCAYKAFRLGVSNDLWNEAPIAQKLIQEVFPRQKRENMAPFFKALTTFVYPEMDDDDEDEDEFEPKLEIVEAIIELLKQTVHDEDDRVAASSLEAVSDLGFKDKMYEEDLLDPAMAVCKKLVDKNAVSTFEHVACFLNGAWLNFKEQVGDSVLELLPKVLSQIDNPEVGNVKHRMYAASSLAEIIADGPREHVPALLQFIVAHLEESDDLVFELVPVIIPLKACFDDANANTVFKKLVPKICETESNDYVASWCHVLAKLLKRHNIDQEVVASLVSSILSGRLKCLCGRTPHKSLPPNNAIFAFLASYIKKSPSNGKPICAQIIDWLGLTAFPAIPALLIPLRAGVSVGIVDAEQAQKLVPTLKEMLNKFDNDDDEQLVAVVGVLTELSNHQPKCVEPVAADLINSLEKFVLAADPDAAEEEDFDELNDLIEAMPFVCQFVFGIYASDIAPSDVNEKVLSTLVRMLPFPPQVEEMPDLLEQLCALVEDEKYSFVLAPILKVFVEILLMKKSELEEYELSDELTKDMKMALKNSVKADRRLEKILTKDFQNQKARLNRFKALLR